MMLLGFLVRGCAVSLTSPHSFQGGPTYWVQKPAISDHWMPDFFHNKGGGWGAHGGGASNWPFRGSKARTASASRRLHCSA